MFLQKLEIHGFKSFAQKALFLFPAAADHAKGITAVVGPNGSGKSNVADAIRWVLGEQSMKLLRGKKSEDVIFFGSDKKAQLGYCEVSLFFNNEDRAFPVDYSEVVITRRLYRSGESEYYLNKNKVRLSDVALMCAQASIGQRSYSVIGQGMIDSIINTAPADRKDFFDEAAGVKQYQMKKDSSIAKLKSTRENLLQAQTLLAELEPKLRFFQRQIKRLEERGTTEDELRSLLTDYYTTLWNESEEHASVLRARHAENAERVDALVSGYASLQKEFEEKEARSRTDAGSGFNELQASYAALVQKKNQLTSSIAILDARLQAEYEKSGEVQMAVLQSKLSDIGRRRETLELDVERLAASLAARREEAVSVRSAADTAEARARDAEDAYSRRLAATSGVTTEFIVAELRDIAVGPAENEEDGGLRMWISRAIDRVRALVKKIEESLVPHQAKESDTLREEVSALRAERDRVRGARERIEAQIAAEEQRLDAARESMAQNAAEEERVRAQIAALSAPKSNATEVIAQERTSLASELLALEETLRAQNRELNEYFAREKEAHAALLDAQKRMASQQKEIESARARLSEVEREEARAEAHQEDLLKKIIEEFRLSAEQEVALTGQTETLSSLLGFRKDAPPCDRAAAREAIERLKRKLEQIGTIDEEIVSEYEATKERYEFLAGQIEDLSKAILSLKEAIADLDSVIRSQFDASLEGINKKFDQYFKKLFNGGSARLIVQKRETADTEEEESRDQEFAPADDIAGIDIEATPPGKKLKSIAVLSGGEKALTAVALICAILSNNPSPFVVLDEVDAALDESNANRLAEILQELSERTQFIVITHNRVTMHIATILYGVTMGDDGVSHVLSLDIRTVGATMSN